MTELTPFLAFEIPIIKKWIPQFEPMRFVHIFQKSLAILLGREFGIDGELHAKNIVEFQYDFSRFLEGDDKHMDVADDNYAQYRNGQTLAVFQSTLSCVFETGEFIGKKVNEYFRGRHWTMLDVGGGEGMFTSELLSKCQTLPQVLTMLDPNESNVRAYRTCISARFDNLRNLDAYAKGVEDVIDDVPIVTFLLASHSLYAVFDRSRSRGAQLVQQLVRQTRDGFAIFIAASQDSYLYTIKKTVLGHLHRIDRSSYGEDLCKAMTAEMGHTVESFDSIVDVSALLEDYEGLIFWLSYFCRVDTEEIRPYYDLCHALIRDTAIDIKCLPKAERFRMEENGTIKRMGLTESSKIVYHKEVIITVPSARHIARI